MSSSINFKNFILEQLKELNNIVAKPMMGEFLLYYNGVFFGGIYDDRFLIKKTNLNKKYFLKEEIPYEKAKSMYLVENLEDNNYLCNLVKETCLDL